MHFQFKLTGLKKNSEKAGFVTIQFLAWGVAFLAIFIYSFYKFENISRAVIYSVLVTCMYLATVYGNSHFLIPLFYRRKLHYFLVSVLFIATVTLVRMALEYMIMHRLLDYQYFFYFSHEHFSFSSVTTLFAFFFGALLKISLNYVDLLQREQDRKTEQVTTELQLLKSQVQPHFLFNALNNIYYLAYIKSDQAPKSIERLSDMMRYFVEDAPKKWITLRSEIEFIKDYIEIEKARLPFGLDLSLTFPPMVYSALIPPMLFIPLVENVFKHGVDRCRQDNMLQINLRLMDNTLIFIVRNRLYHPDQAKPTLGTGLINLRRRLFLIYSTNYNLDIAYDPEYFTATLKIPLI